MKTGSNTVITYDTPAAVKRVVGVQNVLLHDHGGRPSDHVTCIINDLFTGPDNMIAGNNTVITYGTPAEVPPL